MMRISTQKSATQLLRNKFLKPCEHFRKHCKHICNTKNICEILQTSSKPCWNSTTTKTRIYPNLGAGEHLCKMEKCEKEAYIKAFREHLTVFSQTFCTPFSQPYIGKSHTNLWPSSLENISGSMRIVSHELQTFRNSWEHCCEVLQTLFKPCWHFATQIQESPQTMEDLANTFANS